MEHYRKVSSKYVEDILLPNELRVVSSTKQDDFMKKIIDTLNTSIDRGVIVSGCGEDCTRVTNFVEQLKRKITQTLTQSANIKYNRIEDLWEADIEGLDSLKVTRHVPVLCISLRTSEPVSLRNRDSRNNKRRGKQTQSHSKPQTQSHSKPQTQSHSKPQTQSHSKPQTQSHSNQTN